ncbi:MAG TPA: DUF192 domain-containing protein [Steroidobacteraceae bacterium]|jgi:hypothetical protein
MLMCRNSIVGAERRVTEGRTLAASAIRFLMATLALLAMPLSLFAAPTDAEQLDRMFERSTLQIATPDARLHTFHIWIADNDARRERGLMFVRQLEPDAGMLFIYESPQSIAMWMKNTKIPLDMLFVAANGRVMRVAEHTEPESLKTIESGSNVIGVIELNAGTAAKLNIKAGAVVMHPAFSHG